MLFAVALLDPGSAAARVEESPRIREYVDLFTSQTPGSTTGRGLRIDHVNPRDPEGKPPTLVHELVQLHPGTVIDTFAVPQCAASDAELLALGPTACGNTSVVGSGEIHLDTGVPGPTRIAVNDVTLINAANELIVVLESRGSPAPVRLVVRGKVAGNTLDIPIPSAPGADGPTPTFELLTFRELSTVRDGRRLSYITTPPSCPSNGHWTNRFTFSFWDGVAQTFTSPSPCERAPVWDRKPPRIRIGGMPRNRCVSRGFPVRVLISEHGSGLRRARLSLDGRRLRQSARTRFSVRIPVRRLRPGRHRLTVLALDRAHNRGVRGVRFARCEHQGEGET